MDVLSYFSDTGNPGLMKISIYSKHKKLKKRKFPDGGNTALTQMLY